MCLLKGQQQDNPPFCGCPKKETPPPHLGSSSPLTNFFFLGGRLIFFFFFWGGWSPPKSTYHLTTLQLRGSHSPKKEVRRATQPAVRFPVSGGGDQRRQPRGQLPAPRKQSRCRGGGGGGGGPKKSCVINGMEWNGMEWNGMEWNGMEWNGMEWNGMEWNKKK